MFSKKENFKEVGKLVVIDGTDGSGKATQTELLLKELRENGFEAEMADFPQYGQKSAGLIEEYLLTQKYGDVNPKAASIFYAVDRFDASFKIRKWLSEGKIVVSNRYVTANAAHQGGKIEDQVDRLKFFKWLNELEYKIFGIPKPDLNIILHVPPEISFELAKKKWIDKNKDFTKGQKGDLLENDMDHQRKAEKVFLEITELFPNTKLVECVKNGELLSPQEVFGKVWELVRRLALKK